MPNPIQNTKQQEWENEFDERFLHTDKYPKDRIPLTDVLATKLIIKNFIRDILSSHHAEVKRVVEGMFLTFDKPAKFGSREFDGFYNHALENVLSALAKME